MGAGDNRDMFAMYIVRDQLDATEPSSACPAQWAAKGGDCLPRIAEPVRPRGIKFAGG